MGHAAIGMSSFVLPQAEGPRYVRIANALAREIERGLYDSGAALPSEHTLCRLLGVSRVTVRAALRVLAERRLIVKRHGAGTFVRAGAIHKALDTAVDFHAEAAAHGRRSGTQVLGFVARRPTIRERMVFAIAPEAEVGELRRLRRIEGVPAVLQTSVHPPGLLDAAAARALADRSLYRYLAGRGAKVAATEDVVEAVSLAREQAAALALPAGSPVFRAFRTARDAGGRVVEIGESLIRSDFYKLVFRSDAAQE